MKGEAPTLPWPKQDKPAIPARDPYNTGRWNENAECPLLTAGKRYIRRGRHHARNDG